MAHCFSLSLPPDAGTCRLLPPERAFGELLFSPQVGLQRQLTPAALHLPIKIPTGAKPFSPCSGAVSVARRRCWDVKEGQGSCGTQAALGEVQ